MKLLIAKLVLLSAIFSSSSLSFAGSKQDRKHDLIVQFKAISGPGCALLKGYAEAGALYLDKFMSNQDRTCVGCAGIRGKEEMNSAALILSAQDIPAPNSVDRLVIRFYGLHSSTRAHQYEVGVVVNDDLLASLPLGQTQVRTYPTYVFETKKAKTNCSVTLKLTKTESAD